MKIIIKSKQNTAGISNRKIYSPWWGRLNTFEYGNKVTNELNGQRGNIKKNNTGSADCKVNTCHKEECVESENEDILIELFTNEKRKFKIIKIKWNKEVIMFSRTLYFKFMQSFSRAK